MAIPGGTQTRGCPWPRADVLANTKNRQAAVELPPRLGREEVVVLRERALIHALRFPCVILCISSPELPEEQPE